jgi:hypothetical protein
MSNDTTNPRAIRDAANNPWHEAPARKPRPSLVERIAADLESRGITPTPARIRKAANSAW